MSEAIVFDPALISTLAVGSIKAAKEHPDQLTTGIPELDEHYVMLRPGRVTGVLADTSHGKTSFMNILARNAVPQLNENEIVVHATWEDSIEDYGLSYLANISRISITNLFHGNLSETEWVQMMKAATERAKTPLWAIGHSETHNSRRPRLSISDVWGAMEYIIDKQKKKVRMICFDYLQRINRKDTGSDQMREGFIAIMDKVKDMSLAFDTTCVIGSQVRREVGERKWQQPQVHDAQETSNFEQSCDGIISLWIPKRTQKMGECLIERQPNFPAVWVTERLMLMQILKQKRGKAPVLKAVDFVPETNEIRPYTEQT
jgi:replicative DNA helicase